jgi:DNA polymerase-3 subunit beta
MFQIDRKALKAVSLFQAVKDIRYYLNGVCIQASPTETRLIATDGHTLAAHRLACENEGGYLPELIIPSDTVKQVLAWKSINKACADMPMTLTINGNECRITWQGDKVAVFKAIDGKFPDYARVIPSEISGEPAQYQSDYLARCQRAREVMGVPYFCAIGYNGNGPALVDVATNFVAVVMPVRGKFSGSTNYQWAKTALATSAPEVTAQCTPEIAEMIDPSGALQRAGMLNVPDSVIRLPDDATV